MMKFSGRSDEEEEKGMKSRERKKKKEIAMRISLRSLCSLPGELEIQIV